MDKYWYKRIEWALHNIIAHPICEILNIFTLYGLSDWLHDRLMPHDEEDYIAVCTQYELDGEDVAALRDKINQINKEMNDE